MTDDNSSNGAGSEAAATITTIQAIAVALGASVSELLDVEGEELGLAAKTASKPSYV